MFSPLINQHTGEVLCVKNQLEYHKLQYLNMSDSAHIWIPLWQSKKWKELQNQKKESKKKFIFLVNVAKAVKKFEVQGMQKFYFTLKFDFLIKFI